MEIIKSENYGIDAQKAKELTSGLDVVKAERELLIEEFKVVSKLDLTQENEKSFKELRLKIVKNRTQGLNKWHKRNKEFFLTGGKFVDAIKNVETQINEEMEDKLLVAEKHFENLEKERLIELNNTRKTLLSPFVEDVSNLELSMMDEDVWEAYLSTKEKTFKVAEEQRIFEEEKLLAAKKVEEERQIEIQKENEKLREEAVIREKEIAIQAAEYKKEQQAEQKIKDALIEEARVAKVESDRVFEIQKEKETIAANRVKQEVEQNLKLKQQLLNRDLEEKICSTDDEKIEDLISYLNLAKTKYDFETEKGSLILRQTSKLIDKTVIYINSIK